MPKIAGHIKAPPTPIATPTAIATYTFGAKPPTSDMTAKITDPMKRTRRRPNMSASDFMTENGWSNVFPADLLKVGSANSPRTHAD